MDRAQSRLHSDDWGYPGSTKLKKPNTRRDTDK